MYWLLQTFIHLISVTALLRYRIYFCTKMGCLELLGGGSAGEVDTLLDVGAELLDGGGDELLLVVVHLADGEDVLDTVLAELDVDGEPLNLLAELLPDLLASGVGREVNVGLDLGGLAVEGSLEDPVGELGTGVSHGEGGRATTVLSLDDLVTTELDTVDESVALLLVVKDRRGEGGVRLGEEGDDGGAGVAADNGDLVLAGRLGLASDGGGEGSGTDNVEGGDAEETAGVVRTGLLQGLGEDGDGRVDGVGDDEDEGVRASVGNGLGKRLADTSVDLRDVSAHARLPASDVFPRDHRDNRAIFWKHYVPSVYGGNAHSCIRDKPGNRSKVVSDQSREPWNFSDIRRGRHGCVMRQRVPGGRKRWGFTDISVNYPVLTSYRACGGHRRG